MEGEERRMNVWPMLQRQPWHFHTAMLFQNVVSLSIINSIFTGDHCWLYKFTGDHCWLHKFTGDHCWLYKCQKMPGLSQRPSLDLLCLRLYQFENEFEKCCRSWGANPKPLAQQPRALALAILLLWIDKIRNKDVLQSTSKKRKRWLQWIDYVYHFYIMTLTFFGTIRLDNAARIYITYEKMVTIDRLYETCVIWNSTLSQDKWWIRYQHAERNGGDDRGRFGWQQNNIICKILDLLLPLLHGSKPIGVTCMFHNFSPFHTILCHLAERMYVQHVTPVSDVIQSLSRGSSFLWVPSLLHVISLCAVLSLHGSYCPMYLGCWGIRILQQSVKGVASGGGAVAPPRTFSGFASALPVIMLASRLPNKYL